VFTLESAVYKAYRARGNLQDGK